MVFAAMFSRFYVQMIGRFGMVFLLALVCASAQEYVPVPRAGFVRKECIRRVPNGSNIDKLPNGDLKVTHCSNVFCTPYWRR